MRGLYTKKWNRLSVPGSQSNNLALVHETQRSTKVALYSTSSFVLLVEYANTHDRTELRLNYHDGRGEKDWWMKVWMKRGVEGCRGTVRREMVEDKLNEEAASSQQ